MGDNKARPMRRFLVRMALAASLLVIFRLGAGTGVAADPPGAGLAALPESKPVNEALAALGRVLFFDNRISGDWSLSCASCHVPEKGWADGQGLSAAYTGGAYFRNAPSLINARHRTYFTWDGRLDGSDLGTLVRDMVTEAHFMNMDARLAQERVKQAPGYTALWEAAFGKGADPYGPRMFNAIAEFVKTIESRNAPLDAYLRGKEGALRPEAKQGLAVFTGKGNCVACHRGPLLSDQGFHRLGVPENPDVWANPLRAIVMLRHYATLGMPNYMNARADLGLYAVSKDQGDQGKFLTPSLRELKYTAPYMHNGIFATLEEVIEFYDQGGGSGSETRPLGLTPEEKKALRAFLLSASGDPIAVTAPPLPEFQPRPFGKN